MRAYPIERTRQANEASGQLFSMIALALLAFFASPTFNANLIPAGVPKDFQQYIAIVLWIGLLTYSLVGRTGRPISMGLQTVGLIAFYGFTALSVLWSDLAPASLLKSAALVITTLTAYRIAATMSIDAIIDASIAGLTTLIAVSLALVIVYPAVGIDHSWMHNGQWQGIFESKQSLGGAGALLMFLAAQRFFARGGAISNGVIFSLAVAAALGSESRGGIAVSIAGIVVLLATRRFYAAAAALAFGPVCLAILATAFFISFAASGLPYIDLFGTQINLTERTFIWQYGLKHFDSLIFGYGLNGFWSDPDLYYHFLREHGWVLDNFHSGYLTIIMETGYVGMALFILMQLFLGIRLVSLLNRRLIDRNAYGLIVTFAMMSAIGNLTETLYLRSTSFASVLLLIFTFVPCLEFVERSGRRARKPDRFTSLVPPPMPYEGEGRA